MNPAAQVLLTCIGVLLVLVVLRDVLYSLFSPGRRLELSRVVMRSVWATVRHLTRGRPASFPLAGPVVLLSVVTTWALLLLVGWAFILWPHYDTGFVNALDYSIATLTTLGLSDIAHAPPLRLAGPLEALIGFSLLSASISWLLTIHPVLSRRRSLAYELALLRAAESRAGVPHTQAERLYGELTSRLVAVERDFVMFPVAYYFPAADRRFSLAAAMPYLLELSERGRDAEDPDARLRSAMLREAIDDFAGTVARGFHGAEPDSTQRALAAYARDHLRSAVAGA